MIYNGSLSLSLSLFFFFFRFPNECEAGVIDVISPSSSYYPDLSKLRDTLGDDHQRVVWRSKQNLDFAFLMSYAQTKGMFYVQLEDDILAKKNFITTMKSFALQKIGTKENWFVLDFCQLGFIGTTLFIIYVYVCIMCMYNICTYNM